MKSALCSVLAIVSLVVSPAAGHSHPADLSRLVVIGDSLSAGFQNSSLAAGQQVHGYAALIAAQASVDLPLPLIAEPGIPSALELVSLGPPPAIAPKPGTSTGRLDPTVQVMNLAVPGATVQDALGLVPDCDFTPANAPLIKQVVNVLSDFVLGLPACLTGVRMSQVEWAEELAPTTVLVWLGSHDVLQAVVYGADPAVATPTRDFKRAYRKVMKRLAATGATLAVANIPDVTVIPYLTSAEDLAAMGVPLDVIGIGLGDFVTPEAFPLISGILAQALPGPLPDEVVVDAGEVATLRSTIRKLNAFITEQAREHGARVVDIHAVLARAQRQGIVVGERRLTTEFLGGLFSLDGIHPTNTGYAIIANEFIRVLNRRFRADIPEVDVAAIMAADPLVFDHADVP